LIRGYEGSTLNEQRGCVWKSKEEEEERASEIESESELLPFFNFKLRSRTDNKHATQWGFSKWLYEVHFSSIDIMHCLHMRFL
jgi:hypothetical protein